MMRPWLPLSWALICWPRSSVRCGPASPSDFRLSLHSGPCIHPSGQNEGFCQVLRSISAACYHWRISAQSRGKNIPLQQAVCIQESLFHTAPFWYSNLASTVGFAKELTQTETGGGLVFFQCHLSSFCVLNGGFVGRSWGCEICGGPLLPSGEKSNEKEQLHWWLFISFGLSYSLEGKTNKNENKKASARLFYATNNYFLFPSGSTVTNTLSSYYLWLVFA